MMDRSTNNGQFSGLERVPTTLTLGEFYAPTPDSTDDEHDRSVDQLRATEYETTWYDVPQSTEKATSPRDNDSFPPLVNEDSTHRDRNLETTLPHVARLQPPHVTIPSEAYNDHHTSDNITHKQNQFGVRSGTIKTRLGFDEASVQKVEYRLRKRLSSFNSQSARSTRTRSTSNYSRIAPIGKEEAFTSNKSLTFIQFTDIKNDALFTSRTVSSKPNGVATRTGHLTTGHLWSGDNYNTRNQNDVDLNRILNLHNRSPSSRYKHADIRFNERNPRSSYTRGKAKTTLEFNKGSLMDEHRESPLLIERMATPRSTRVNSSCGKETDNTKNNKLIKDSTNLLIDGYHEYRDSETRKTHRPGAITKSPDAEHPELPSVLLMADSKKCFSIQNQFLPGILRRQMNNPLYRPNTQNENSLSNILIGNKHNFSS